MQTPSKTSHATATPPHASDDTSPTRASSTARSGVAPRSLDALLDLSAGELLDLYCDASVPRLGDLRGDLRGRMLAIPSLPSSLAWLPRTLARSDRFPWRGKSFTPRSDDRGEGVNRVILDRWKLFRFTTSIGPSRAGAFDALHLDYDHPGNPSFIRRIQDEIRQISLGLYLGQAYLAFGETPRLGLYFGLTDARESR